MAKADGPSVAATGADPILHPGALVVRRSVFIAASPERVWREFESSERMNGWWGAILGPPEAGTSKGQHLRVYEPHVGGRIEMEVSLDGVPARYGGRIVVFDPGRELTFENDWIQSRGWLQPTRLTVRLTPSSGGTLVEILHYAFEGAATDAGDEHAGYEGGWGMTQLNALRDAIGAQAGSITIEPGALVVRRSIQIEATPERVWRELETFDRFSAWWAVDTPELKTAIVRWEPGVGGWFENRGTHSGAPINFSGRIVGFDPPREVTFEWTAPSRGWTQPTYVTIRLTPVADHTLVEILHHGWERLGAAAVDLHAGFEGGWSLSELVQLKRIVEAA